MYPFQKLRQIASDAGYEFRVIPKLAEAKPGEIVVIGGKIVSVLDGVYEDGLYIRIDDGLDTTEVYLLDPVRREFEEHIFEGNEILVKGRVVTKDLGPKHPDGKKRVYVLATSIAPGGGSVRATS